MLNCFPTRKSLLYTPPLLSLSLQQLLTKEDSKTFVLRQIKSAIISSIADLTTLSFGNKKKEKKKPLLVCKNSLYLLFLS